MLILFSLEKWYSQTYYQGHRFRTKAYSNSTSLFFVIIYISTCI